MLGELDDWRRGLAAAGIEVAADDARGAVDLVVAPTVCGREATARAATVILDGRPPRSFASSGQTLSLLARPNGAHPSLLLPLRERRATAYAVDHWSVVDRRWKVARMEVAKRLLRRGLWPPIGSFVTVWQRAGGSPAMVHATRDLGLPDELSWFLALGQGDDLSRNVFHLFRRGADEPDWVLKFARLEGRSDPFDRDQRGLTDALEAGGTVAARAPRLVGRLVWEGIHASVETAARGHRLRELLVSRRSRAEKRQLIDLVAGWILAVARRTASSPEALAAERERLLDSVLPNWRRDGATDELVLGLPPLPAVLQHNDLGSWNVLVHHGDFTVVDWESSRRHGFPLWDLFYFLADSLALLDGDVAGETRHLHTAALFRGETPSSEILFRWVRDAVTELEIPPGAVGALATLCWLHHGLSPIARRASLESLGAADEPPLHGSELNPGMWLSDPALGAAWDRWSRTR